MDVTKTTDVNNTINKAAQQLGGLHILINSAALPGGSPKAIGAIETIDDASLIYDFDVKYVGALRCSRAAIPFMKKEGWGRIVNISGGNARIAGNLSGGARNVSLVHLTKTLSDQLGRYGITVNCIHPGTTRTERTPGLLSERAKENGITLQQVEKADFAPGSDTSNSIGRMVEAQEIGYLSAFLASDKAWAITGEVIGAGGGTGKAVYY
jgi:NAD(P)-dependent dehydrogenase (short-subunit alcohol dehydrogenase family)